MYEVPHTYSSRLVLLVLYFTCSTVPRIQEQVGMKLVEIKLLTSELTFYSLAATPRR